MVCKSQHATLECKCLKMLQNMRFVIFFYRFLNSDAKMTTCFANGTRTTADTSRFKIFRNKVFI